jgi:hypothetical protein
MKLSVFWFFCCFWGFLSDSSDFARREVFWYTLVFGCAVPPPKHIFRVWAASGAPQWECGGLTLPPKKLLSGFGAPGAARTPTIYDFRVRGGGEVVYWMHGQNLSPSNPRKMEPQRLMFASIISNSHSTWVPVIPGSRMSPGLGYT